MFIAPSHRGSVGLANELMTSVMEWSVANGLEQLWLGTTSVMRRAHTFYRRHGFREIDKSALPPTFPVMAVDSVFFQRPVTTAEVT